MHSALLFYRKFRRELEGYGLEVNPYDPCVANVITRSGEQLTVVWHVDGVMATCNSDFELTKFAVYLSKIYGPKLTMHTGNKFDYLGMDMEFADGEVKISMNGHLDKAIEDFPEEITGKSATPAGDHLFKVREEGAVPLDKDMADAFHHSTAQLLFISNRVRRDIQTPISFLAKRVKAPDNDNWGKLRRLLKYLNGTRRLKLRLKINSIDDITNLTWYVDAAHAVHWDSKGHAGAMLMLGVGALSSYSRSLKLNTRSFTETELVSVDLYLPQILWTMYFLQKQGYPVDSVLRQRGAMNSV